MSAPPEDTPPVAGGWVLDIDVAPDIGLKLADLSEMLFDAAGQAPPALDWPAPDNSGGAITLYFTDKPSAELLSHLLSAAGLDPALAAALAPLPARDWVSESQARLAPVRAGRFWLTGSHDAARVPPVGTIPLLIDAGRAFGTGHHATTRGCLKLLVPATERPGNPRLPLHMLDVGTGSAVLAVAAAKYWPDAVITASDIDPVAIEVARTVLTANDLEERPAAASGAGLHLLVADGVDNAAIAAGAPYDLITANILSEPLIAMAAALAGHLAPAGRLLLSGLTVAQRGAVEAAYRSSGLKLNRALEEDGWAALELVYI